MLVFNQQANIKNVNGAIADIFANRPAPQSTFYLFYATDTQEIYYDNGAWILLGTGGGGGTNIYNSDGTLTGLRQLDGNNNSLYFNNLAAFGININDSGFIRKFNFPIFCGIDFSSTGQYFTKIFYRDFNNPNDTEFYLYNSLIKTKYNNSDIGIKLDFANDSYSFGNINGMLLSTTTSGTFIAYNNQDPCFYAFNNYEVQLGDVSAFQNGVGLFIKDQNQIISTKKFGADIGLYLDFANQYFKLGNGSSYSGYFDIDNLNGLITAGGNIGESLFGIDYLNAIVYIGDYTNFNGLPSFAVVGNEIKSAYQGNDIGLKLDFANGTYQFGDISNVNNFGLLTIAGNDVLLQGGGNNPLISIENTNSLIKTRFSGTDNGYNLDFANHTYTFGRLTGGNTTQISIEDASAYPIQIDGTNVTAGTAGGNSGQHLKIKVNGVDYKIALLNP